MTTDTARLDALIAKLEGASAPDRSLFEEAYEAAWGRPCRDDGERGELFRRLLTAKAWTDAAMSLVPEGWFWRAGRTTLFAGWAWVHATHPDHGEPGRNEFGHRHETDTTPALALCIAALKARRAAC